MLNELTEAKIDAYYQSGFGHYDLVVAPLLVLAASMLLLRRKVLPVRIGASVLMALGPCLFFLGISMSWVLRDGLAPGMEISHGQAAVRSFTKVLPDYIVMSLIPLVLGLLLALFGRSLPQTYKPYKP